MGRRSRERGKCVCDYDSCDSGSISSTGGAIDLIKVKKLCLPWFMMCMTVWSDVQLECDDETEFRIESRCTTRLNNDEVAADASEQEDAPTGGIKE